MAVDFAVFPALSYRSAACSVASRCTSGVSSGVRAIFSNSTAAWPGRLDSEYATASLRVTSGCSGLCGKFWRKPTSTGIARSHCLPVISSAAASKSALARTLESGASLETRRKSSTAAPLSPALLFDSPCL